MNPIISALVKDFQKKFELLNLSESEAFEFFSAYCSLNHEKIDQGDFRESITGDGEEGLDAIAILINGTLVLDVDDARSVIEGHQSIRARYIFVQAKTSEKWDGGGVLKFTRAVEGFFDGKDIGTSAKVDEARLIHAEILSSAAKLEENPSVSCYFVATGTVEKAGSARKYLQELRDILLKKELFSSIKCDLVGNSQLQAMYRAASSATSAEITFGSKVTLPQMPGIDQAYLGILPAVELMKLIDDEGEIRKSVFEDNVRDFQGDKKPVNARMAETLANSSRSLFSVMNNGITIVARDLRVTGDIFQLKDYQIVNGAQTSHVLFNNRSNLVDPEVSVPVKLIQTSDEDVITSIVTATNSQTEIKLDELNARAIAERNVERFFAAKEGAEMLRYERRSHQYDAQSTDMVKARIIDRLTLLRSIAATFGDEPHIATGYGRTLVQQLGGEGQGGRRKFLRDADEPIVYYAAAALYYRLDLYFKTGRIDSQFKPARWHILNLSRRIILDGPVPDFSDRKVRHWVKPLIDIVWKDDIEKVFSRAVSVVEGADLEMNRLKLRSSAVTAELVKGLDRQ